MSSHSSPRHSFFSLALFFASSAAEVAPAAEAGGEGRGGAVTTSSGALSFSKLGGFVTIGGGVFASACVFTL